MAGKNVALVVVTVAALLLAAALVSQAADRRGARPAPGGAAQWIAQTRLEIVGAVFPTLPTPHVSIELRTSLGQDGADPADEARTGVTLRATLTPAEARAVAEALIEFADNPPAATVTILSKTY